MPEELQNFLLDLSTTNADEVWKWLDANPHAVDEMVAVLLDSHPDLE